MRHVITSPPPRAFSCCCRLAQPACAQIADERLLGRLGTRRPRVPARHDFRRRGCARGRERGGADGQGHRAREERGDRKARRPHRRRPRGAQRDPVLPPLPGTTTCGTASPAPSTAIPRFWSYAAMSSPPIHIIVERGHVTLSGTVSSNVERTMARIAGQRPRRAIAQSTSCGRRGDREQASELPTSKAEGRRANNGVDQDATSANSRAFYPLLALTPFGSWKSDVGSSLHPSCSPPASSTRSAPPSVSTAAAKAPANRNSVR